MQIFNKYRTVVAVTLFLVIAYFFYSTFFKSPEVALLLEDGTSGMALGADLLEVSNKLSQVSLGQALFANPSYLFLTDFSQPVPPQPVGRSNPFRVIGQE